MCLFATMHSFIQIYGAFGAYDCNRSASRHISGLPQRSLNAQLHRICRGNLHLGGFPDRTQDPYVFYRPQLQAHYGNLFVCRKLAAHQILFFGQMISGTKERFHMLLGKMYMSGGYAHGNHIAVSGIFFLFHGFHYHSGNQFNLIRLHSHTHFSS